MLKIDKTVILHINSHLSVHTSFIRVVTVQEPWLLVCVVLVLFSVFIDTQIYFMCILTYLSITPIQTLVIWLPVDCCESGCPVIKVTRVKYGRPGRIDLGSCPYRLSQENFLAISLFMHGGYVGSFLLSIKLIISFLLFLIKKTDAWLVIDKRKYFLLESILCNSSSRILSKSYYKTPGLRRF